MRIPAVIDALEMLAERYPNGSWAAEPVIWYNDHNGTAHGSQGSKHGTTAVHGTLGAYLSARRCENERCANIMLLSPTASTLDSAEAARAFLLVTARFDNLELEAEINPGNLYFYGDAQIAEFDKLQTKMRGRLEKDPEILAFATGYTARLQTMMESCAKLVNSDEYRQQLVRNAVDHLMFNDVGPLHELRLRLWGAETTEIELGEPDELESWEDIAAWRDAVHRMQPTRVRQLEGLVVEDPNDLIRSATKAWREKATEELDRVIRDMRAFEEQWLHRNDLVAIDVQQAHQIDRPERMSRLMSHRRRAWAHGLENSWVSGLIKRFGSAQYSVTEISVAFAEQLDGLENLGRIAILPAALAHSLTTDTPRSRVELGVIRVEPEHLRVLATATALLDDGGVYENLEDAWAAARKLV